MWVSRQPMSSQHLSQFLLTNKMPVFFHSRLEFQIRLRWSDAAFFILAQKFIEFSRTDRRNGGRFFWTISYKIDFLLERFRNGRKKVFLRFQFWFQTTSVDWNPSSSGFISWTHSRVIFRWLERGLLCQLWAPLSPIGGQCTLWW